MGCRRRETRTPACLSGQVVQGQGPLGPQWVGGSPYSMIQVTQGQAGDPRWTAGPSSEGGVLDLSWGLDVLGVSAEWLP